MMAPAAPVVSDNRRLGRLERGKVGCFGAQMPPMVIPAVPLDLLVQTPYIVVKQQVPSFSARPMTSFALLCPNMLASISDLHCLSLIGLPIALGQLSSMLQSAGGYRTV